MNPLQRFLQFCRGCLRASLPGNATPGASDRSGADVDARGEYAESAKAEFDRALGLHQAGRSDEAESMYRALLRRHPDLVDALHFLGVLQAQRQNLAEAAALIGRALAIDPDNAAAHSNLGNVFKAQMRHDEAVASYNAALALVPDGVDTLISRGAVLGGMGRHEDALADYDRALAIRPDAADALLGRGSALLILKRFEEGLAAYQRVLEFRPDDPDAMFGAGVTLVELKRYADAVAIYDRVLALKPDAAVVHNSRGIALWHDRQYPEAIASYDRAIAINPQYADAHFNRGIVMASMNRHAEALASYDLAISFSPGYAKAYSNRGAALVRLQLYDEALASYDRALQINPDFPDALNNRAGVFRRMGLHERAAQDYACLLELDPDYEYAAGNRLYSDALVCDWRQFDDARTKLIDAVLDGKMVALPFQVAVLSDSAAAQLACARTHVNRKLRVPADTRWTGAKHRHERIRVGYLSADFHAHATIHLIGELFERHDREKFEVSAWSFGADVRDEVRERLKKSFEQFNDVRTAGDVEVARMLRDREIDIAVDLKGFTDGCRPGIFAQRAAPIQVNFLGYPGTTGADYMDYIVGDAEVIPESHDVFYAEKVVRMPDSYQVNGSMRVMSDRAPDRVALGLPASGFVFCCFNNNYKITPDIFDIWMRLLKRIDGSVLWLLQDSAAASRNLVAEAAARGVGAERLVFAPRVPPPEFLSRQRLADLFLDTLPCNAHTTASDALWAGIPVLTCRGGAFPGRVAASLLRAIGLPELITESRADYEALAIRLATSAELLVELKSRLVRNRATCPLYDIDRYRSHIERAYMSMYERYQRGEAPASFSVPPGA